MHQLELELREAGNELWELEGVREKAREQGDLGLVERCEARMLAIASRGYAAAQGGGGAAFPVACYVAGLALRMLGRWEEAAGGFRRLVEAEPSVAEAWLELTAIYAELDRPIDALKAAQKAAQLLPGEADVWINLGRCLVAAKEPEAGAEAFRAALELDPSETRQEEVDGWLRQMAPPFS